MRVAYIGNFKHPWCTEQHYKRSFEALGHQVAAIQEDHATLARVEGIGSGADLLLYTRTWGLQPADEWTQLWRDLEAAGTPTASVHLDLFWGLDRETWVTGTPREVLYTTQHVFTADGDHQAAWDDAGINHHWLPPAVVHDETDPGIPMPQWRAEVGFVGSRQYHSEWPHRQDLLRHLERWPRYRKFGDNRPRVRGRELNDVYRSVDVMVGDSLLLAGPTARYVSDRWFECWGRGGFLLHPETDWLATLALEAFDGVAEPSLPGAPLFWPISAWGELDRLIRYWIDHPDERQSVTARMRQYVVDHHTYRDRAAEILTTIGLT